MGPAEYWLVIFATLCLAFAVIPQLRVRPPRERAEVPHCGADTGFIVALRALKQEAMFDTYREPPQEPHWATRPEVHEVVSVGWPS